MRKSYLVMVLLSLFLIIILLVLIFYFSGMYSEEEAADEPATAPIEEPPKVAYDTADVTLTILDREKEVNE